MPQQFNFPAISATNPSVSGNTQDIPSSSTLIGGENPSGDLIPVQVTAGGEIIVGSSVLPTGAATEATQLLVLGELEDISAQLPATLGAQTIAASVAVNIASNQTVPVSAASLPLPTGAATEATLATRASEATVATLGTETTLSTRATEATLATRASETTVASILANTPAPGQAAMAASSPVVIASDQTAVPVSATNLDIRDLNSATDSVSAVQSGTWNITNISGTVSLPTGAATSALQTALNAQIPTTLGQTTMANSMSVTIASNQSVLPTSASTGRAFANAPFTLDYSGATVTTAAYTQIIASTTSTANMVEVFDSSGQAMILAVGAAASEVNQFYILPGGNGQVPLAIPAGSRVSIRALTANATTGYIIVNLYT